MSRFQRETELENIPEEEEDGRESEDSEEPSNSDISDSEESQDETNGIFSTTEIPAFFREQQRNSVGSVGTSNMSIDFPSLEKHGYTFGSISNYWNLWTVWEPQLLHKLHQLPTLNKTLGSIVMKPETFYDTLNKGFARISDDPGFGELQPKWKMRSIIIRLEFEENTEPFLPLSESVRILASVFTMNNSTMTVRVYPIYLVACTGLANILRAICRKTDILIISGTFKTVLDYEFPDSEQFQYLLTNYDNDCGRLQIVRLTFLDDESIKMIEKISPTNFENRFKFEYTAISPDGQTQRREIRHRDFTWTNSSKESPTSQPSQPLLDILFPIQREQEAFNAYHALMRNKPSPKKIPQIPLTNYHHQHSQKAHRNIQAEKCVDLSRNMPVFFASSKDKSKPMRTITRGITLPLSLPRAVSGSIPSSRAASGKRALGRSVRLSSEHDFIEEEKQSRGSTMHQSQRQQQRRSDETLEESMFVPSSAADSEEDILQLRTGDCLIVLSKIFVLIFILVGLLALLNAMFTYHSPNSHCIYERQYSATPLSGIQAPTAFYGSSNGQPSTVVVDPMQDSNSYFVRFQKIIHELFNWIWVSCGLDCVKRMLANNVSDSLPVV